jgi:ABC-type phosphate transport system substrate-binding protein
MTCTKDKPQRHKIKVIRLHKEHGQMTRSTWVGLALFSGALMVGATGCGGGSADDIIRVSRQSNSGTYEYFREFVVGKDRQFKQGSMDQNGSKEVVSLVSTTRGAIGYSGMGYNTPEVKMLNVSHKKGEPAIAPTIENAKSGKYPIARALYVYTAGEPTSVVKHYIDWMMSAEGQDVVKKVGFVPNDPKPAPPDNPDLFKQPTNIKCNGSDTMVNLGQAWSEDYGKKHPNVKIEVSGGGSGTGITALIDGQCDICFSSREMKPAEKARAKEKTGKEVTEYTVGMDALGIYVHKDNPIDQISVEELSEIYGDGGKIEKWSQLSGAPAKQKAD